MAKANNRRGKQAGQPKVQPPPEDTESSVVPPATSTVPDSAIDPALLALGAATQEVPAQPAAIPAPKKKPATRLGGKTVAKNSADKAVEDAAAAATRTEAVR